VITFWYLQDFLLIYTEEQRNSFPKSTKFWTGTKLGLFISSLRRRTDNNHNGQNKKNKMTNNDRYNPPQKQKTKQNKTKKTPKD
jgi:hypothetical protein